MSSKQTVHREPGFRPVPRWEFWVMVLLVPATAALYLIALPWLMDLAERFVTR